MPLTPGEFAVLKNNLEAITDDMSLTIMRTSRTPIIRDGMDFSTAICTPEGEMVAQGVCIALHLGSIPVAMEALLEMYRGNIHPGDVFILNDPYSGGMHLPDIFLFKPVFIGRRLTAFVVTVADFGDIGGMVPGGRPVNATDLYQEGITIPPLKLFDGGRRVDAIPRILERNVRLPELFRNDLESCLAAVRTAEAALVQLVGRFGLSVVAGFLQQLLEYSESITRATIGAWPDGTVEFEDHLDDSVAGPAPVLIKVRVTVDGSNLHVDFTGTSEQVRASINSTRSFTASAVYAAVRTMLPPETPSNGGVFRPIHVDAPEGTIVNPRRPGPVASRGVTGFRVVDAMFGALAKIVPDRVQAAGEGGSSSMRIGGYMEDGRAFVLADSVHGTRGGGPLNDGMDGFANFATNSANRPVERIEAELPVRVWRYGLRPDSEGPGKYRGGLGLEREWELLTSEAVLTIRADRVRFAPWGLQGGGNGSRSRNLMLRATGEAMELPGKVHEVMRSGDRFHHEQASGGGFGDPLDRDPVRVLADWRDERVSAERAFDVYGVLIDEEMGQVDLEATRARRSALSQERGPA
ncbi:MAG TPA: hydantoinase B/oxoprolinase family protein [Candidatus Saccharimonadales bacterium]|nr:hydantoinase B/oxoprolinase family protein [Candidatus Saccharimonadales bacterium]